MKDLTNIKFWLFDLDNTLYDGATKVFDQVDKKMSKFIKAKWFNNGIRYIACDIFSWFCNATIKYEVT